MSRRIHLLALPGCSATGLMGALDLLQIANRIGRSVSGDDTPLFEPRLVSVDGAPVRCGNGVSVAVQAALDSVRPGEILLLPALMLASRTDVEESARHWGPVTDWLRRHGEKLELLVSSCSGAFLLAEAGLLDGARTTTAWWLHELFAARYPAVTVEREEICVWSRNMLCGAGSSAYQDVCLAIVERYGGRHFARLLAKYLMIDNQRRSQAPYAVLGRGNLQDGVVARAETWIRQNLQREFRIDELAAACAVSPRTLIRHFRQQLDETPQAFTQKLRIEKCKILLETTALRFGDIAQRCGYNDESALRRLFKRHCQLSPRDYRQRFNRSA